MFCFCLSKAFSPTEWLAKAPQLGAFYLLVFAGAGSQIGFSPYLLAAFLLPLAEVTVRYRFGLQPGTGGARFGIGLLLVSHSYFLAGVQVPSVPTHGFLYVSSAAGLFRFFANLQYVSVALLSLLVGLLLLRVRVLNALVTAPHASLHP